MPATRNEIDEAREEGITIVPGRSPARIEIEEGKITGLHTVECTSVFDEQGRFNPTVNKEDTLFIEGSMIVEAIGQSLDEIFLSDEIKENLEYEGRRIKVNEHFQSNLPWLFFGGDMVRGPNVITAVANGHEAARGIDLYLNETVKTVSS